MAISSRPTILAEFALFGGLLAERHPLRMVFEDKQKKGHAVPPLKVIGCS